jgi:hypothetical protein
LNDDWDLFQVDRATVYVSVRGSWQNLQMVIARTTIDDFIKAFHKLQAFFMVSHLIHKSTLPVQEQLKNSRMVWGTVPSEAAPPKPLDQPKTTESNRHTHWQRALDMITQIQCHRTFLPIPKTATVLGGSLELEAGQATLV